MRIDIDPKPLLALKTWFIVTFVIAWNVGCLLSMNIEGSGSRYPQGPALWVLFGTMATSASLATLIVMVPKVRYWLTEPQRRERYSPEPFVLIAVVTGFLAVFSLWQP